MTPDSNPGAKSRNFAGSYSVAACVNGTRPIGKREGRSTYASQAAGGELCPWVGELENSAVRRFYAGAVFNLQIGVP